MKTKISIISNNNLLEKTLKSLPELSSFNFITEEKPVELDTQLYLLSEDIIDNKLLQKSLILKKPIDINYIINHLVNFSHDQDRKFDIITFNFRKKIFSNGGITIDLTEIESSLIEYLLNSPENSATKMQLIQDVLGYSKDAETKTLENHLYKLKAKLKDLEADNFLIINGEHISINTQSENT